MDLFGRASAREHRGLPLAERMRPRVLSDVVGQDAILGAGTWLRRALSTKALTSIILWGPPGVGKTTIGGLLAKEIVARFVALSAVMSGVKDIREAVAEAAVRRDQRDERTILFIDEIHRFNKAQQDALLPHVESGTVILVGATTENPSFEVNAPLLSRAKVLVLQPLGVGHLRAIVDRALVDRERGLGTLVVECADDIRDLIAREAHGDARRALTTLDAAVAVPEPDANGRRVVDRAAVEQALQRKALLYDKVGDEHYGVVSAFIKSMRGSDPDAAVYWMARMLEAGEAPLFVMRRLVIFASEDVGNADPRALVLAIAAMEAVRFVGLPEALLPMTQAATYLATAEKSNTAVIAYAAARQAIEQHGALPVPLHLRNATTPLQTSLGHGRGYQYPHDFPDHHVDETYLPQELQAARFYQPTDMGEEKRIGERMARRARSRDEPKKK